SRPQKRTQKNANPAESSAYGSSVAPLSTRRAGVETLANAAPYALMCRPAERGSESALRYDLVQVVERVLQRYPLDARKAGVDCKPPQLGPGTSSGSESGTAVGKRRRHTVEDAEAVEQRPERAGVLLQPVGAVDVEAHVCPARLERPPDRAQQSDWIDGVVDH